MMQSMIMADSSANHVAKEGIVVAVALAWVLMIGSSAVASVMFSLMLIGNAAALSQSTGTSVVAVGPLKLVEIIKLPLEDGGYRAGFRFLQTGILQYFAACALTGLVLGILRARMTRR